MLVQGELIYMEYLEAQVEGCDTATQEPAQTAGQMSLMDSQLSLDGLG